MLYTEAMEGGPIALVEDGDVISIDIPNRRLELCISDAALAVRKARWRQPEPKVKTGYLSRYVPKWLHRRIPVPYWNKFTGEECTMAVLRQICDFITKYFPGMGYRIRGVGIFVPVPFTRLEG